MMVVVVAGFGSSFLFFLFFVFSLLLLLIPSALCGCTHWLAGRWLAGGWLFCSRTYQSLISRSVKSS
ncbi:hypothetical protein BO70DRAFT_358530 [Aspergillus heteromorphus CBS 117.55]|uniref:Uncharacterized protein n=1 Tax=Aspergillus heteromorphus CBS 117.55 TaxID=1448321 RepID=A0A317WXH3_9EURO|nr:uncharacterized protein BO70DRAFT_358530 [Aspergillus heteromorphus CBS 117.55]PWY91094.1 hypothetical protein BO70DRAFT_358530 [Aspergillus heteromorphus CBS 117.55]